MPSSEWVRGPGLLGQWASQWWVLSPRPASLPGTPHASGSSSLKTAVRLPVWGCGERGVCQCGRSVWRDRCVPLLPLRLVQNAPYLAATLPEASGQPPCGHRTLADRSLLIASAASPSSAELFSHPSVLPLALRQNKGAFCSSSGKPTNLTWRGARWAHSSFS